MNNAWNVRLIPKGFFRLMLVPLLLFSFALLTCNQDSIFYDISNEPEPKDPLIPGSPTNIVLVRNRLFVGTRMSNRIYCYFNTTGGAEWTSFVLPQGASLGELATDGKDLYVLVFPSGEPLVSSAVRRYNLSTNSWDMSYTVSGYSIQTIFGVEGKIFAGGQHYSNYLNFAIFYLEPYSNSLTAIKYETSLLKGAVQASGGRVYLATASNGMLFFNEGSMDTSIVYNTEDANFTGMISVGGGIVAVTGDGAIYINNGVGFSHVNTSVNYTGGMCVWSDRNNQWGASLLLMGTRGKGTSLTHGYREMVLNNGNPTFNIRVPGDDFPTSVKSKAKYEASVGTHPVMSIMQIPDVIYGGPLQYSIFTGNPEWEPPIFASTAKNGLWSYRNGEWNAEE